MRVYTHVTKCKVQMPSLVSLYLTPLKQGLPLNLEFTSLVRLVSQQARGFLGLSALGLLVSITMPGFLPGV